MSKKKNIAKAKQVEISDKQEAKKQSAKQAAKPAPKLAPKPAPKPAPKQDFGLLVTKELQTAIDKCKEKVDRIAKECQASNRKFRDIEFDLKNDKYRCLYGLFGRASSEVSDVHRLTQLFEKPQFFVDGASADDIVQGQLDDTWFLSALATASTAPGLIEKICVARDEAVGVYGFIFFRDHAWVPVIIDDMVFTNFPKYEELNWEEQKLYHFDKDTYNKSARKGGKALYFASSGKTGETWVPLIEKAYAKLHGNYSYIEGGHECDALADMTGGVSSVLQTKDLLNPERFWHEELTRANKDRLFGCSFSSLDSTRSGNMFINVQGLIGDHAYSVLRAVECNGKKFVILRNPWGGSEWTGRWSDGSKEWTYEWLELLPQIGHAFGDDGQFIMEYSDWLEAFERIDRTILFDSSWVLSSEWVRIRSEPLPSAWSYADVSFKFTLPSASNTVVVLSQLDTKYYRDLAGKTSWSMDFALVKEGETEPIIEVAHSEFYTSNVNAEVELEAGTYIVYVRLNRRSIKKDGKEVPESCLRLVSRIMTERAKSQSIALNFDADEQDKYLPTPLDALLDEDAILYAAEKNPKEEDAPTKPRREVAEDATVMITTSESGPPPERFYQSSLSDSDDGSGGYSDGDDEDDSDLSSDGGDYSDRKPTVKLDLDDPNSVYVGLRVYTHKDVQVEITPRLP